MADPDGLPNLPDYLSVTSAVSEIGHQIHTPKEKRQYAHHKLYTCV